MCANCWMHAAVAELHLVDTHRLIPSKYSEQGTVFSRLSDDETTLNDLLELDGATNDLSARRGRIVAGDRCAWSCCMAFGMLLIVRLLTPRRWADGLTIANVERGIAGLRGRRRWPKRLRFTS